MSSMSEAAFDVVDHLGDGDGVLVDVEDWAFAQAVEDLLEDADEVDGVGGDLAGLVELLAGESPVSRRKLRMPGLVQVASSICCFCMSI